MRKMFLLIVMLFIPFIVYGEDNKLYNVLKNEAENGGLAREYTREHHDSYREEPTDKIYYWSGSTSQHAEQVNEKRNVIFAGMCFRILRTTDIGGVRLIYNGKAENNKCLNNRPSVIGATDSDKKNMSTYGEIYYGTDYENSSSPFKLSGDLVKARWSEETAQSLVGKYTVLSNSESATGYLYYISDVIDSNYAMVDMIDIIQYDNIGNSELSIYDNKNSIGSVGYMHNKLYKPIEKNNTNYGYYSQSSTPLSQSSYNVISNSTNYPYSFNTSTGKWTGSESGTSSGSLRTSIKFKVTNSNNYLLKYTTTATTDAAAYVYLNGKRYSTIRGASSGVLTLNLTTDDEIEVVNTTYRASRKPLSFSVEVPSGSATDTRLLFGNSFVYENGIYRLVDTIRSDGTLNLSNNHYTCFNTSGECENLKYVYYWEYKNNLLTYDIEDGKTITDLLNEMLYDDDSNKYNSPLKNRVDSWFEKNLLDYQYYLEDSIYCNDIRIKNSDTTLFNPNGGSATEVFNETPYMGDDVDAFYQRATELLCAYDTGKFSTSNPKARLKYPVALPTLAELLLMSGSYDSPFRVVNSQTSTYWTMTPYSFVRDSAYGWEVTGGSLGYSYASNTRLVTPVITLKKGIEYTSGTGSKEDPYIIKEYEKNDINIDNDDKKGTVEIDNVNDVVETMKVLFKVIPKDDYIIDKIVIKDIDDKTIEYNSTNILNEYEFVMPDKEVTIKITYKKVEKHYKFIEGMGQKFNISKDSKLRFRFNMEYEDFLKDGKVYIDNREIDSKYYELSEGPKTVIVFSDEYSRKLSVGKHEIVVTLSDGSSCSTDFTINSGIIDDSIMYKIINPGTADKIILVFTIMILSLGIYRYLKYKKLERRL